MARLSATQYERILTALGQVSEAMTRDEFATAVIAAVPTMLDSDVTTLNEVDPAGGRLLFWSDPDTFHYPADAVQAWIELAPQHPLIHHYDTTGDGSARRISDFLTPDEWHANQLYQLFYKVIGVEFQMSITLPAPRPIVIAVAVNRSSSDFDEQDRAMMNLVRPHLAHAWRQVREHERLQSLLDSATGVLAASGAGAIALTDPIHELTTGALVSLYRFFGRPGARDPLPPRTRQWIERQASRSSLDELQMGEPLRATRDGRQLVLRYLPRGLGDEAVILLNESIRHGATQTLRAAGLTQRESEVLELVTTGSSTQQMAAALGVSPWTIKRHLASIYAKLGVTGRGGATAVALEITAHHSDQ